MTNEWAHCAAHATREEGCEDCLIAVRGLDAPFTMQDVDRAMVASVLTPLSAEALLEAVRSYERELNYWLDKTGLSYSDARNMVTRHRVAVEAAIRAPLEARIEAAERVIKSGGSVEYRAALDAWRALLPADRTGVVAAPVEDAK